MHVDCMPVRVLSNKMADVGLAARDFMNNKVCCESAKLSFGS